MPRCCCLALTAAATARPKPQQVDTIKDVFARLHSCWKPPPPSQANPIDITVIVSFNREGAILGRPRITYKSEHASDNDRLQIPDRRDGDIATLHAVAIYRGTGRRRCRPAFRDPIQNPQNVHPNPKRREHG